MFELVRRVDTGAGQSWRVGIGRVVGQVSLDTLQIVHRAGSKVTVTLSTLLMVNIVVHDGWQWWRRLDLTTRAGTTRGTVWMLSAIRLTSAPSITRECST